MVIDTSALFAIEAEEPEMVHFDSLLRAADRRLMSAASAVELAVVLTRRRLSDQRLAVDDLLSHYGIEIVDVDESQMRQAWLGFIQFGKGRHPARLNFGDCFSYALAKSMGEPLLFKGEDFTHTDLTPAA